MVKYKAIRVEGVKIDEHRYIMEQHIGRALSRKFGVCHATIDSIINGETYR